MCLLDAENSIKENELIHRLIDEKKWTLLLREIEQYVSQATEYEDQKSLLSIFESIDEDYLQNHAQRLYTEMWKIAFKVGKIKIAKTYGEFALDYLIEYKRIPRLKKLIEEFKEYGLFKNHPKFTYVDLSLGRKINEVFSPSEDWSFLDSHPEAWKNSKSMLKQFLIGETEWTVEHWRLAYEYVLKFYFDRDVMILLAEKSHELNKKSYQSSFIEFLGKKKISIKLFDKKPVIKKETAPEETALFVDYDQLAMDVMSGVIEPSITEQRKILISIDTLSTEDIISKGKDMVVAFGLLGMDKVVMSLCEKIIPHLSDPHEKASLEFMQAQSMYNSGDFYKSIDLIDDIFSKEPLLEDELIAFNYLKAESLMKLKKFRNAKEIFLGIKKRSPNYRLVSERLRYIETIK
jgi:hypothetical protein